MNKWSKQMIQGTLVLLLVILSFFSGCAKQAKETGPQPTVEQMRGDSNRFFNTMEEEEKNRSNP